LVLDPVEIIRQGCHTPAKPKGGDRNEVWRFIPIMTSSRIPQKEMRKRGIPRRSTRDQPLADSRPEAKSIRTWTFFRKAYEQKDHGEQIPLSLGEGAGAPTKGLANDGVSGAEQHRQQDEPPDDPTVGFARPINVA
jgi:hypothetical protein